MVSILKRGRLKYEFVRKTQLTANNTTIEIDNLPDVDVYEVQYYVTSILGVADRLRFNNNADANSYRSNRDQGGTVHTSLGTGIIMAVKGGGPSPTGNKILIYNKRDTADFKITASWIGTIVGSAASEFLNGAGFHNTLNEALTTITLDTNTSIYETGSYMIVRGYNN